MNIIDKIQITMPRVLIAIEVVKSFFTRPSCPGRCLPVKPFRQYTSYSCCASVAQSVLHYYGFKVGHVKAIKLTKCRPDGASLQSVARVLKREYRLMPKTLRTRKQIRAALRRGEPVITNDDQTYEHDHAILLVGQTPKGFYVADPVLGAIHWKHEDRVLAGASEWIAVAA